MKLGHEAVQTDRHERQRQFVREDGGGHRLTGSRGPLEEEAMGRLETVVEQVLTLKLLGQDALDLCSEFLG
jgi:hypothetical protein